MAEKQIFEVKLFPGEGLVKADYEWAVVAPYSKLANLGLNASSACVVLLIHCLLNQLYMRMPLTANDFIPFWKVLKELE